MENIWRDILTFICTLIWAGYIFWAGRKISIYEEKLKIYYDYLKELQSRIDSFYD